MKIRSVMVVLCIISLLLSGCGGTHPARYPNAVQSPGVSIQISSPGNGTIVTRGAVIILAALIAGVHTSDVNGAVFLVNGASVRPTGTALWPLEGSWTAPDPGEYFIQAKLTLADGSIAISEPSRVCVLASLSIDFPQYQVGYMGVCPLATPVSNIAATGGLTFRIVAEPNPIDFSPVCAPEAALTFVAYITDPQELVGLVAVNFRRPDRDAIWGSYLNWITTHEVNQKEFRVTIHLSQNDLLGASGFHWFLTAWGRTGRRLQMIEGDIPIQQIQCSPPRPIIAPPTTTATPVATETATPTPVEPPTLTLNKNAFCRKGPDMSFPDVTAVLAGEKVNILNVSEDGFWYFIYWEKFDTKCWVVAKTGDAAGDLNSIVVLTGPTLPAPKPGAAEPPPPTDPPAPCNPLIRTCP